MLYGFAGDGAERALNARLIIQAMYCSPHPPALHIAPAARLRGVCLYDFAHGELPYEVSPHEGVGKIPLAKRLGYPPTCSCLTCVIGARRFAAVNLTRQKATRRKLSKRGRWRRLRSPSRNGIDFQSVKLPSCP